MTRRALLALLGALVLAVGTAAGAAEDEKRIINGPSKTSFGGLELVLGQGASAETAFQPDASKLVVKTITGEARIVTSAKNLILVESAEGRVEILLPNGRLIVVEPGKAEIVGRALNDVYVDVDRRMAHSDVSASASMLLGGQRLGGQLRLFLIYREGNFIEATDDTPYLQIGEHKYGKPILDRVVRPEAMLGR